MWQEGNNSRVSSFCVSSSSTLFERCRTAFLFRSCLYLVKHGKLICGDHHLHDGNVKQSAVMSFPGLTSEVNGTQH